ncbi:M23 family metallopeptidase [Brachybacterium sp. J153]|uniref:M23 family metallopeptidase n=1 Tax=Brachybacterium sp. J153 TaxID=3116488 RepID=UPI002E781A19|nr:M23 family metallopeptidase [Brachybacterium sp. J153]MEE1617067.1 M23 family metallopeptidase [Brachybacterium sp. J153]
MRKLRATGGTHRDAALPAGMMKAGVLGVLATATIAAPLAAAAAGIDEPGADSVDTAAQLAEVAPVEAAAPAPVALPVAQAVTAAPETREADDASTRSEERTAPAEDAESDEATEETATDATGIEIEVPEPEPEVASTGPVSESGFIRPVDGPVTSGFGGRIHPVLGYFKGHNGVDFGNACGTPVQASAAGTVIAVEYNSASGNRVKIDHGNGIVTGYYHLQGFNTSEGATVEQGDIIGYVGSTGRSTGCHLHFAKMDESGNYSNPMSILR